MTTTADRRRAALAKIHIAKARLGMADEDYRALLRRVASADSARDLTPPQVDAVLAEFRRLGFDDPKGERRAQRPRTHGNAALMARIEKHLAAGGLPWTYAEAMAWRMFKIRKLSWLSAANLLKLNAALEIAARRQEKRALPGEEKAAQ